jgi:hypothetical protein
MMRDLKGHLVNNPEYAVALRKCMKGALPHLFPGSWGGNNLREYMDYGSYPISFRTLMFWISNMQRLTIGGKKKSKNSGDQIGGILNRGHINRLFESIFGGTPDSCDDTNVKYTYWRELDDGDDASGDKKELVQSIDLFGGTPLRSIHLGSYPNLRRVTAHGQNCLDETVPPHVDVVSLASPSLRGLGNQKGLVDGLLARAISDKSYGEDIVGREINGISEDRHVNYDDYGDENERVGCHRIGVNRHGLLLLNRSNHRHEYYESTYKCRGAVSYVLPLSFFRVVSFCKELSLFCGYGVFKSHASHICDDLTSVAHYRAAFKHAELEGPGSFETCWDKPDFAKFCQQYEGENSCLASVLPIFVEQSVIDSDTPFGINNNLVCVDDKPLWDVALVLARQYFAKNTRPDVQSFIESCGISVNRIPDSTNTKTRAYLLARQIYKSQFVRDMLDDVELLLSEYFKTYKYVEKGVFDNSNPLGLSKNEFDKLSKAIDNEDDDDDDDDYYYRRDCDELLLFAPKLYRHILKQNIHQLKTANVWRKHRCVYEAIEAQSTYGIGASYFDARGDEVTYNNGAVIVDINTLFSAANGGNPA